MKNKLKVSLVFILAFCVSVLTITAVAAEGEDEEKVLYTITSADGEVTGYTDMRDFSDNVEKAPSGSTVTLCSSVEVGGGMRFAGSESSEYEITIDLAGYGVYSYSKITMFSVSNYATLNITSSEEGGFLYIIDSTNASAGGNILAINGVGALCNMGGVVKLGDVSYPGTNISTFSSCFVDVRGEGTIGFNCDGGQHFANIADWKGFINPRNGTGTITMKNADVLVIENSNLIHSEDPDTTLYMENCVIVRIDGTTARLFNDVNASIVFKNCVSNYSLVPADGGVVREKCVTLEGRNVFGAELGFDSRLVDNGDGSDSFVAARTVEDYELAGGGDSFWYFDNTGKFSKHNDIIPALDDAYLILPFSETVEVTWSYNGGTEVERWHKDTTPVSPISISGAGVSGLYKYGWLKTDLEDGRVTYTGGPVVDFNIKVSCEYDGYFFYHILIPAFVIDDGYLSFVSGSVDGVSFSANDWSERELDGEKYYEYTTSFLDGEDAKKTIEVSLPCDIPDGKKLISAEGIWRFDLAQYLDEVYATESEHTEEQMAFIDDVKEAFFGSSAEGGATDGETAWLPATKYEM